MFKHILIPTDGSPLSEEAARDAVRLARETGATVTAMHVLPQFHVLTYDAEMLEETREEFERAARAAAAKYLATIEAFAGEAGVPCSTLYVPNNQPYEGIIQIAKEKGCDLIAMASHGRSGVKGFFVGSETQKVLAHCETPVLVLRSKTR